MTISPRVALIIVVWNKIQDTVECLKSLTKLNYPCYQTIVVDNGSTDNTAAKVKENFPDVLVIRNDKNLGYAGGCNVGLKYAYQELDAAYYLILNNDTVVYDENFLDSLVNSAEGDETIGIVAPLVRHYDPPQSIQCAGIRLNLYTGRACLCTRVGPKPIWTEAVHGCAFMIKREVIEKVGGVDEQFYLYWEETDYCIRVKQAGYRLLVDADTCIFHKSGSTIGGRGALYTYYFFRNRLLLMRKHAHIIHWLVISPLLPVYALVHILKSVHEGNAPLEAAIAIGEAWRDFLRGRFGRRGA